ncbi:MAG: FHA domain-containing protein, partial [Kiritimatiellaeota bacterium]|nr:FHA domain-containing protein [Kiritimatiellota bacterium]
MADEVILRAVAGSLKDEEFVFDEKGLCLIGRSNDCALQIPKENDMRISRRHCLIILDPPNVRVRDLNSRNGTFVNDVRLKPGVIGDKPSAETPVDVVLNDGDVLSLGETVLEFSIPSKKEKQPARQQPPQGTKVIKLARPSKTHTGSLVPKAPEVTTADSDATGFFKPPKNGKPAELDIPAPMTELFSKPVVKLSVNGEGVAGAPSSPSLSGEPSSALGAEAVNPSPDAPTLPSAQPSKSVKLAGAVSSSASASKSVVSLAPPKAADLLAAAHSPKPIILNRNAKSQEGSPP